LSEARAHDPVSDTHTEPAQKRYLILAEEFSHDPHYGKTLRGVMRYRREAVVAILDTKRAGETDDGVPIVGSVNDALCFNPNTALVGVVTQGGHFPGDWQKLLKSCVAKGLDLENGLHVRLRDIPGLPELASKHGVELRDLREPPSDLSTATGENLEVDATIVLTVGSDCAIGKMTATCELDLEARKRGLRSVFVPTGQTGIAIAGWGIAVDHVISDYVAGAADRLVRDGAERGDLLWIEGQGSIYHPAYSGVTLGLLHGSRPDVLLLCHQAGAEHIDGYPATPIPPLAQVARDYETAAGWVRPAPVAAIALNTAALDDGAARAAIAETEATTGIVTDDVVRYGPERTLDAILSKIL
jgi:uncharacterized NAD-dependent epimerase/dehydratase family protein